jgi:hypothetical protein
MVMASDDIRGILQCPFDLLFGSFRSYNLNRVWQEAMPPEPEGNPRVNNYLAVICLNDTTQTTNTQ